MITKLFGLKGLIGLNNAIFAATNAKKVMFFGGLMGVCASLDN